MGRGEAWYGRAGQVFKLDGPRRERLVSGVERAAKNPLSKY